MSESEGVIFPVMRQNLVEKFHMGKYQIFKFLVILYHVEFHMDRNQQISYESDIQR